MNIFTIIITAIFCILGLGSSVLIVGYMLITLIRKIFRKIAYGASLYD